MEFGDDIIAPKAAAGDDAVIDAPFFGYGRAVSVCPMGKVAGLEEVGPGWFGGDGFYFDIAPADGAFFAGVDLEAEEAGLAQVVDEVGAGDAVDPGTDGVAGCIDGEAVPGGGVLEGVAGGGVAGFATERVEPAFHLLGVDAAGPSAVGGFHFGLVAVDDLDAVSVGGFGVGAEHDAGVPVHVPFEFGGKDEVVVGGFGGEEGVGIEVGNAGADDFAVFDVVGHLAAFDGPTGEVAAVKEVDEAGLAEVGLGLGV